MDKAIFETAHLAALNDQQRAAVEAVNGPVLLLAVPGSGKTTVLITRLGYMTEVCGIAHYSTTQPGGFGAAREFCDLLLAANDAYATLLDRYAQ